MHGIVSCNIGIAKNQSSPELDALRCVALQCVSTFHKPSASPDYYISGCAISRVRRLRIGQTADWWAKQGLSRHLSLKLMRVVFFFF